MKLYIFNKTNLANGTPIRYGIYTVVILAETEEQAWELLFQNHSSEKSEWEFETYPIDKPGEVTVCIE